MSKNLHQSWWYWTEVCDAIIVMDVKGDKTDVTEVMCGTVDGTDMRRDNTDFIKDDKWGKKRIKWRFGYAVEVMHVICVTSEHRRMDEMT